MVLILINVALLFIEQRLDIIKVILYFSECKVEERWSRELSIGHNKFVFFMKIHLMQEFLKK